MIRKFRVALIRMGKIAPFVLCFIVLLSYIESLYALITQNFIEFPDGVYLYKPISWAIASFLEYELPTLLALIILSISVETCIYNKLSCLYLGVNLFEKSWFAGHETDINTCIAVCSVNIVVAVYLTYKGIKILTKQ